jgi:hypothetical protein
MKILAKNNRKTTFPLLRPAPAGPQALDASGYACLVSAVALTSASWAEVLASFSLEDSVGAQPIVSFF